MKVDVATVRRLAELSKLSFSENEETEMVDGLNEMIAFVDKLKELDTANVEPLVFMTDETNVLREDVVEAPLRRCLLSRWWGHEEIAPDRGITSKVRG